MTGYRTDFSFTDDDSFLTIPRVALPENDPVQVGQKLGKYLITDKLGEGGMGMVFGGVHEGLGRKVAVKLLRAEFAKNEMVVSRFQQEAEAVSRIGHSNIVAIYDFGKLADGSLYYVMERIAGETLTARMARQPEMDAKETVAVFSQICRALHATHSRGIVHRDLKPDNVLLQPQDSGIPHVKVLDFGVAKMRALDEPMPDANNPSKTPTSGANLTKVGTLLGTPTYMAPEQITSSMTVDGRADLYSLGSMLYEVLTGQPPFGRGELMVVLTRHVKDPVIPPSQKTKRAPGSIPPALDAFLLRALAKVPSQRQQDPNQFITELETAWGVSSTAATGLATGPVQAEAVKRRPKWLPFAIGGGVLALVGGGAAIALSHKGTQANVQAVAAPENPLHTEANKILATALAGDAQQRRAAVEAMGEVADHSAMDQIINALGDDNPEVRRVAASAALAIAKPEDTQLRQALAEAGQRSGGAVAVDIAAARYRAGDDTAEEDLKHALEMRDPAVRLRAATALAQRGKLPAATLRAAIAGAPPTTKRSLRWEAYRRLQALGDTAFNAELRVALAGKDPVAKLDAAQTLAKANDNDGLTALSALATEAPDPIDRVDAAAVQAELGDTGALDALAAHLTEEKPSVRARAATSLGRLAPLLPDQRAVARQLSPLLKDTDANVRISAAAGLLAVKLPASTAPAASKKGTP